MSNLSAIDPCIRLVGDRMVIEVDGLTESTSLMWGRLVRAGTICREQGIRKVLYLRRGNSVDALTVAELVKSLADFGFRGCRIAAMMPHAEAAYPWMFLEQLANHGGVRLGIFTAAADADSFLDGAAADFQDSLPVLARCA